MKIVTIIGARPQFIKAAAVSRAFRNHYPDKTEVILHTGQHYDANMSDVFFDELDIPLPNYHLGIGGGTHGQNTGRMLEGIESILMNEKPDWVLVYGDTDSTLAGALAASKLNIPVAHVEAGLRSFNRFMPEELNRILTDHVSDLLFTPTDTATQNLKNEGISASKIHQVGDVMYDATLYYLNKAEQPAQLSDAEGFILSTIHRAENTDNPERLSNIIKALNKVAREIPVILPLHPRTRKLLREGRYDTQNITLLEPVSYLQMVWLLDRCRFVITDSGGLQKEAYFFNKACITVRNETEWVELVEAGWNALISPDQQEIALQDVHDNMEPQQVDGIYGDGNAAKSILGIILQ